MGSKSVMSRVHFTHEDIQMERNKIMSWRQISPGFLIAPPYRPKRFGFHFC